MRLVYSSLSKDVAAEEGISLWENVSEFQLNSSRNALSICRGLEVVKTVGLQLAYKSN